MTVSRRAAWSGFALLIAATLGRTLGNGFVFDDLPIIVQNPRVTDTHLWHGILLSPYWVGTLWRPLTIAGFALQWAIGGGAPWVFHLISLAGYFGLAMVLFALLQQLGIGRTIAAAIVVLFLADPVHVEVVASAVGQGDLWAALALTGSVSCYLRIRRADATPLRVALLLTLVAAGMLAKEYGFMALPLLAGAEWLLVERTEDRFRWLTWIGVVTAALFLMRMTVLGSAGGELTALALERLSFSGRVLTFFATVPRYALLTVWPWHLQALYGPPELVAGGPLRPVHLLGAALVLSFIVVFVATRRRAPLAAFGLWWFAVTLAPVTNLVSPTGLLMAERALFIPGIGAALVFASVVCRFLSPEGHGPLHLRERRLATLALATWTGAMAIHSFARVPVWHDQDRFMIQMVVDAPRVADAWKNAGEYRALTGNANAAISDLRHALALWPADYLAAERLGHVLESQHRCGEALAPLASAVIFDVGATRPRSELIECQLQLGDYPAARQAARDGISLGQTEFLPVVERIDAAQARADSGPRP